MGRSCKAGCSSGRRPCHSADDSRAVPSRYVSTEVLERCEATCVLPDESATHDERRQATVAAVNVIASVLSELPRIERNLLTWRFIEERTVREIADRLQMDPKALYRVYDLLLRRIRVRLRTAGVEKDVVEHLCGDDTSRLATLLTADRLPLQPRLSRVAS